MLGLPKNITLRYYKRLDIQEAMIEHARDKEVGMCFGEGYGKRPDALFYPRDVLELALKNVTSFHTSEERWSNPLALNSGLSKQELEQLRLGWDLVLDIDCAFWEYSKICADLVIKFLKHCGVEDLSCKFSGNKGLHIGVPFEAFPKQVGGMQTKDLFPEAPRKIAFYIKENIKEILSKKIMEHENNQFSQVKEKVKLPVAEIIRYETNEFGDQVAKLNVDKFLEIDTILISTRHLYRMPYSLHEKSGLASLPLDPEKVLEFEKKMAEPDKILIPLFVFLDRNVKKESARSLLIQALDFEVKSKEEREEEPKYEQMEIDSPLTEEFFPPCLKLLSNGLGDGKKRGLFCLINFLGKIGWKEREIKQFLTEWNKKNREPLREVYLRGQLNHFQAGEKLPPNCNNEAYYLSLGVCQKEDLCRKIKNPVNYSLIKWKKQRKEP